MRPCFSHYVVMDKCSLTPSIVIIIDNVYTVIWTNVISILSFYLSLPLVFSLWISDCWCSMLNIQYSILNTQYYSERVGVFIIFCFVSTCFFSSSLVCSLGYMFSRFFQSSIFFSLSLPFFHYSFYLPIYQSTYLFTSPIQVDSDQSTIVRSSWSQSQFVSVPVSGSGSNPNSVLVNAFI